MSKLLIGIMGVVLLSGCDGVVNPSPDELISPVSYEIDGWGSNPDIYEWTPKGNTNYFCMYVVSGADSPAGMFCMPKGDQ